MVRLTRWEPVREMSNLGQGMERVFDELMGRSFRRAFGDENAMRGSWVPPVDIRENKDGLEIVTELPGFKAEDVDVTVENGVLSIRGERKLEEAKDDETYHRVERSYGVFERTFTLPNSVDVEKINAKFKDGVMKLSLPKREESKPKSIKVKIDSK